MGFGVQGVVCKVQGLGGGVYRGTSPIRKCPPFYTPPRTLGIGCFRFPGGCVFS